MRSNQEWQCRLETLLEQWHGSSSTSSTRALPIDPVRQAELLGLHERHAAAWPWPFVHASWLTECLPEDDRLRHWCLTLLPEKVRASVAELGVDSAPAGRIPADGSAAVLFEPLSPPSWLADWWRHEITRLGYPPPLPESTDLARPLSYLWCFSPEDVQIVLERFGLRCLAAQVSAGPARRAAELVFALSPGERPLVVELVRARAFPPELAEERFFSGSCEPVARALETLALAALDGSPDPVRRLAYRLPSEVGRCALSILSEGESTDRAAVRCGSEGSLEPWLQSDIRELLAECRIQLPIPGEVA